MPPIEVGSPRAIGAVSAEMARKPGIETTAAGHAGKAVASTSGADAKLAQSAITKSALVTSEALDPGQAPVDTDRVSQVRKAVESGSYPLVPARIADAMIAAGMFLRSTKA